tara:strand:- start:63 stop:329 length:267 start_codon:yes stop_codon:yes gene_type:complete
MERYTNLWLHEDGTCLSEGPCHSTMNLACRDIISYTSCFNSQGYYYHATYIENLKTGELKKIDLTDDVRLFDHSIQTSLYERYPIPIR